MGPPDRLQFLFRPDYWIVPGAVVICLDSHLSTVGVALGPFSIAINWGSYMKVCEQ